MSSIQETNLKAIADAIRAKEKSTGVIQASKFAERIAAIQSGITPKLVVTTRVGAAVTATKGSKTVSGTAGADGTCTLELSEAGEWSVTSAKNGVNAAQSIVIGTQSMKMPLYFDSFADNTWEEIIAVCRTGIAPDSWAVGDSKPMVINGTNYQIDIIGKDHDVYADGSGTAPLTFQLHDCYGIQHVMNSTATTVGGWNSSVMRLTHLPALLALMPEAVQSGIRAVSKKTSEGGNSTTIKIASDKLFLLSEVEVFGSTTHSAAGEGTQYDYYKNGGAKIKKAESTATRWWERSPDLTRHDTFCIVTASGYANTAGADTQNDISFAFCF